MPNVKPIGGLVPLNDYAAQFGLNPATARRQAAKGMIPCIFKLGSRYYVPRKVVDAIAAGDPLDQFMALDVS